jgi:conjugal transfer pilus assembly protein TraB
MQGVKERIKEKWEKISPEGKRKILIFCFFFLLIIGIVGLMSINKKENKPKQASQKEVRTEEIDTDLLKKTQYYETIKMVEELKKANEDLQKQLEELKKEKEKETTAEEGKEAKFEKGFEKEFLAAPINVPPPPPPPPLSSSSIPQLPEDKNFEKQNIQSEKILSGIGVVSEKIESVQTKDKKIEEKEVDEKFKKKYYLPPSFMEATLLSGLDAPAVAKGSANTVPVLLRIKAPAVLPNKVKANLKGCFIIAEGLGNLATERADLRLVSLSCIDRKGRAVIDQKIKGFIVDTDGKIGLRGRVVSKMGSVLARAFLAGFVSGFGNVLSSQAYDITTTPSGTLSTIKPGEAAQAGLGMGVQQSANELMKFYLELARQSIPVVEVLPTRNVTAVISEGVELEVKEAKL